MTELWIGAVCLLLLSGLFILFPRWFVRGDRETSLKQDNLAWLRLRQRELAGDQAEQVLLSDAGLRLLEDEVDQLTDEAAASTEAGLGWLILPIAALAALLYLQLGAAEDVKLSEAFQSFDPSGEESNLHELMAAVAARADQRPQNLDYQAMLGRYYMGGENYEQARQAYLRLVEANPADSTALALAAQAGFMAKGRVLDQESQMLAERALNQNPHERSALGLLGMVAFERQHYRAAIGYWQRLLAVEEPGSQGAELIEGVIARAQQAIANGGGESEIANSRGESAASGDESASSGGENVAASTGSELSGPHVTVRVQMPSDASFGANDVVFVFARNAASQSRMPVAAKRFSASQLPLEVRLDDAASMAGQKISALEQVLVFARISRDGQPGEEYASWQGQLGPLAPHADNEIVDLVLEPR
jgi:cytochrome c-type biogenesis protein CcmH